MKFARILATLAVMVLLSCSSERQKPQLESDFPSVEHLDEYEMLDVPDYIERMDVKGDYIVFKTSNKSQHACLIDTANDRKQFFLTEGRGPGETTNLIDISFYDERTVQASVDPESIMLFDVDSLLAGKTMPEFVYRLSEGQCAFPSITKISEHEVLYCGKSRGYTDNPTNFCIESVETGTIKGFGNFPDDEITKSIPTEDYSLQTAYQAKVRPSPDKDRAVAFYFYALGFEVLDTKASTVISSRMYSPLGAKVTYNEVMNANFITRDPEALRGFLDVAVTEEYFYLLASLKRFCDDNYNKGQEVYRYSWDGTPDKHFQLALPTSSIAVSADDKTLYAIKNESDYDAVVMYKIQ